MAIFDPGLLVALPGYGERNDIAQAVRAGFDAHLTKPVGPQVLLDLLASRIRRAG